MKKIWFDIINPPNVHFFNSIKDELPYDKIFTVRKKDENYGLCEYYGINCEYIGKEYKNKIAKNFNIFIRSFNLYTKINFDYAVGFENPMSVLVGKMKRKKVILICDNDLKLYQKNTLVQDIETKIKSLTDYFIIPRFCYDIFIKKYDSRKIRFFNGFKEDIYIANYKPDPLFLNIIPFQEYIIIRPEALFSYYIKDKVSIVKELIELFLKENYNIIYLPRDNVEYNFINSDKQIHIPDKPLNGLDLCYYSQAVLTGSGTMSREAAIMGKPAISFFPSDNLLSVDRELISEGRILHSRKPMEILDHIVNKKFKCIKNDSSLVKAEFIDIFNSLLKEE